MNENKVTIESGRTIIGNNIRKQTVKFLKTNQTMLDQMQENYNRANHFGQNQPQESMNANILNSPMQNGLGLNLGAISSLLPLLTSMNKGSNGNIMELLPKLMQNGENDGQNANVLSQLLPLIGSMQSKKNSSTSAKKIDSLTRADS